MGQHRRTALPSATGEAGRDGGGERGSASGASDTRRNGRRGEGFRIEGGDCEMNGIHDMGGMHGMGPVVEEKNEPVFHHEWEGRIFAMNRAAGAWRKWNLDASRHSKELIPPAEYLRMSYYERWVAGLVELIVQGGLATRAEIESGVPAAGSVKVAPVLTVDKAVAL